MQAGSEQTLAASARVAQLLAEKVRAAGFTQRIFAAACGISFSHTAQLLRGREPLKVKHLYTMLHVLEIPPAAFFSEVYPRTTPPSAVRLALVAEGAAAPGRTLRLDELVRAAVTATLEAGDDLGPPPPKKILPD